MTNLPRLELTEDPNKNNEYIIYRYPSKGIHIETTTEKGVKSKKGKNTTRRRTSTKGRRTRTKGRRTSTKGRRTRRKSFFNIF